MFRKTSHLGISLGISAIAGSSTFLISTYALSSPAYAWFNVCNKSADKAFVAFAYLEIGARRPDIFGNPGPPQFPKGWTSEGWWNLDSGECTQVYPHSLRERNSIYYVYAETSDGYSWSGSQPFCTINSRFTLGRADRVCGGAGTRKSFIKVDVGGVKNYTFNLTN